MTNCDRCGKPTQVIIMSMFNTENICLNCKDKEEKHPKFREAVDAELKQMKRGNYNYAGIGKPEDL